MEETAFARLSEDVVLNIFLKLEDDPRNWARLACVCTKFSSLVRNFCWKKKCSEAIPSIVSELLSAGGSLNLPATDPPGGWASLHKLSICCPGLLHAGVLLENSDFGLERDIGPDENYLRIQPQTASLPSSSSPHASSQSLAVCTIPSSDSSWSLFDDLYFDTVYDVSESHTAGAAAVNAATTADEIEAIVGTVGRDISVSNKRRKQCRDINSHLASGMCNLSREQGNKLLASRCRGDCLYICDWPGCVHTEEKRNYMLFRGVFKNFKRSRVWRTINDTNRSKIALDCAFCSCKETWDLHSAFCLRRVFGYHDDGEPVVRAYVCENGHVSGAWTDRPMVQYLMCSWLGTVSSDDDHKCNAQPDKQDEVKGTQFGSLLQRLSLCYRWKLLNSNLIYVLVGRPHFDGNDVRNSAEALNRPLVLEMITRIPKIAFCCGG